MFDGSSGQSAAIREAVPLFQQVYKIIRAKCPQWHEGNVQLMGVYLAITFLEYGLNSQTLGVDGQRWVQEDGEMGGGWLVGSVMKILFFEHDKIRWLGWSIRCGCCCVHSGL